MHGSVMAYLRRILTPAEVQGKDVLEVGSYNVNGSPRDVIVPMKPNSYLGVDQGAGPGVDQIVNASDIAKTLGSDRFDLVISTEMLEHAENWKGAVKAMKTVVKPHGLLVLTARGPGMPYHGFPDDHWRFTVEDCRKIFPDMEIIDLQADTDWPGILMKARKPEKFFHADISDITVASAPKP
jgi:SAM-dependent methyltransferase